jgi:anti-anti-sigma factor
MSESRDAPLTDAPGELSVVRTWESDRLVLVLHGELAVDTLSIARAEVTAAEGHAPPVLVLDLSQLEYLDSSGVQLVLLAQHAANEADRRLAVRLGDGPTRNIFDALGITERLDVLDAGEASPP